MKKIFFTFIILIFSACSKPDYRVRKKIVIRPIERIKIKPVEKVVEKPVQKIIGISINFDFDKSKIRVEDKKKLDDFIEELKTLKGDIVIIGHTDTNGDFIYNDKLSMRRAIATKKYLEEEINLDYYNVIISGRGEYDSLVEEITALDMFKNRRVTIVFKEK